MPSIGARVHELRMASWRIVNRVDQDAVVIVEVFRKTTERTPKKVIDTCRRRLARYDSLM
jgi:phage-related protein